MDKKVLLKLGIAAFLVLFAAACGTTDEPEQDLIDEQQEQDSLDDPINEEIDEEAPINLEDYNDGDNPTNNEPDEDFGEELDEEAEQDIEENYLEKDEETESGD